MFERFSDSARRVLVMAQDEARLLDHGFIGTEHLVLGLMHEPETRESLSSAGATLDGLRDQIVKTIAVEAPGAPGSPPFTPRAKKVLELSLREMLARGGANIEPGDLLLGVLREGEGVGVQALKVLGVDLQPLRQGVLDRSSHRPSESAVRVEVAQEWQSRAPASLGNIAMPPIGIGFGHRLEACVLCGRDLWEVDHYVSDGRVTVCQVCIEDAFRVIQDAPAENHRLTLPPRVFGAVPHPDAPSEIARAVASVVGPGPEEGRGLYLEDADDLRLAMMQAGERLPSRRANGVVRRIRFVSEESAWVELIVQLDDGPGGGFPFQGPARRIEGNWKVTRELLATMLARVGITIPPAG